MALRLLNFAGYVCFLALIVQFRGSEALISAPDINQQHPKAIAVSNYLKLNRFVNPNCVFDPIFLYMVKSSLFVFQFSQNQVSDLTVFLM